MILVTTLISNSMADQAQQSRFSEYRDDDSTLWLNWKEAPFRPAGRYAGFEMSDESAGNTLVLNHVGGFRKINPDNDDYTDVGVLVTRQGLTILENLPIELTISPNISDFGRMDLIICTHRYIEVTGGTQAIYSVVEGTPDSLVLRTPSVPNSLTDSVIGYVYSRSGTQAVNDVEYTPAPVPNFAGNDLIANLNDSSIFRGYNTFLGFAGVSLDADYEEVDPEPTRRGKLTLASLTPVGDLGEVSKFLGNYYRVSLPDGYDITQPLQINEILSDVVEIGTRNDHTISIYIPVETKLYTDGNLLMPPGLGVIHVAGGTYMEFKYQVSANPRWRLSNYRAIDPRLPVEFRDVVRFNSQSAVLSNGSLGNGNIQGNFWRLTNNAPANIDRVYTKPGFKSSSTTKHFVVLELSDNPITLRHGSGNATDYKELELPGELDYTVSGVGKMLMLVETNLAWRVVGLGVDSIDIPYMALSLETGNGWTQGPIPMSIKRDGKLVTIQGEAIIDKATYYNAVGANGGDASFLSAVIPPYFRPSRNIKLGVTLLPVDYRTNGGDPDYGEFNINMAGSMGLFMRGTPTGIFVMRLSLVYHTDEAL